MIRRLRLQTNGQCLYHISDRVQQLLEKENVSEGLCTLFVRHTSCSLLIQENADPSAKVDLERWMNRLVKENDALYTHTLEGADDMPAHIKSALTATQLAIPFADGHLLLGTWQGVFLWEHRHRAQQREIIIHLNSGS